MYTPDTESAGTVHDADTPQLPQSMRPVAESVRQAGCDWGRLAVGRVADCCRRAPVTCQALGADPGFAFSHATGLAHAAMPAAGCTANIRIVARRARLKRDRGVIG